MMLLIFEKAEKWTPLKKRKDETKHEYFESIVDVDSVVSDQVCFHDMLTMIFKSIQILMLIRGVS